MHASIAGLCVAVSARFVYTYTVHSCTGTAAWTAETQFGTIKRKHTVLAWQHCSFLKDMLLMLLVWNDS